jgi:hypothetical protein
VKRNADGEVDQYKAILVAKGYVQCTRIDFSEVFMPVARLESIRVMLALAAHESWEVHHMDMKSAFLNGTLMEEVYVPQPSVFHIAEEEQKVLRLCKAQYSLCQAPGAWNAKLNAKMLELGFQSSNCEHGGYT